MDTMLRRSGFTTTQQSSARQEKEKLFAVFGISPVNSKEFPAFLRHLAWWRFVPSVILV
jgi:hypothetical protein